VIRRQRIGILFVGNFAANFVGPYIETRPKEIACRPPIGVAICLTSMKLDKSSRKLAFAVVALMVSALEPVPASDPAEAARFFQMTCALCHGANGEPDLSSPIVQGLQDQPAVDRESTEPGHDPGPGRATVLSVETVTTDFEGTRGKLHGLLSCQAGSYT